MHACTHAHTHTHTHAHTHTRTHTHLVSVSHCWELYFFLEDHKDAVLSQNFGTMWCCLNVTNSLSCSTLNDTLSHSLFFRFICSAVWFVHWGLLAAPRGDAGSSNIICCDYVCVCVYGPVRVIAISSGLQGWPWTVQLTTIVNVSFFFSIATTL